MENHEELFYIKKLYPSVNDSADTMLPSCWNQKDKNDFIGLSNNCLAVNYKGQGKTPKDAASVRANHPIPSSCGIYYFEVKIISKGRDGYMGIGLSASDVNTNRLPGWDNKSYGYHGDDGHSFCCSGQGEPYGPTFTTGDVIGCCVNLIDHVCFFTKNGVNLGVAFKNIVEGLYPTVGLQTPGEIVEANFGRQPFVFEIGDYLQQYKTSVHSEIDKVSLGQNNELWQTVLRRIMSSYLVHYGYCATAESFARDTSQSLQEEIASIKNRQLIQKLVLSGKMGAAITTTQDLYPGLLEGKPYLLFMLKCRQFVEMINGVDVEIQNTKRRSPLPHHHRSTSTSAKSSPYMSPHSHYSVRGSGGGSPYRPSLGSPRSTQSIGAFTSPPHTDYSGQELAGLTSPALSNGSIASHSDHNGSGSIPELNGSRHVAAVGEDNYDDEGMDIDIIPKATARPTQSGNELAFMKILQFGRELKAINSKLNETLGTNEENNLMLEGIFSLLAYADPWNSPVGSQLDPVRREPVCAALNSAILELHELPALPVLESILGQTRETLKEMNNAGIGSSSFAQLTDYVHLCKTGKEPSL